MTSLLFSSDQSKTIKKLEIPIKFTILDLIETPDAAELVNCLLELDEYEKISFKFGLMSDSPQDVANRLVEIRFIILLYRAYDSNLFAYIIRLI